MDRAGAELRATGQTKPQAGDNVLDRLTPQEFEIVSRAASGLSGWRGPSRASSGGISALCSFGREVPRVRVDDNLAGPGEQQLRPGPNGARLYSSKGAFTPRSSTSPRRLLALMISWKPDVSWRWL